ncbi:DMT family transporter [Pacificibacter maritimus]|uniref:DMT family transporter n=1 Tax=Pacificibacter maritimus TaxID=762213 RepID=UPI000F4D7331|nr:SMR family transporter [Pacificibacter maritimus]
MKYYIFLLIAIISEVIATTALARTESFTRLVPSVITVVGYACAFWCLSITLRVMPTGLVYAIWSGMGIVFISAIAWIWFHEKLDFAALLGMGFIVTGVLIVNLFSKSMPH